MNNFVKNNWMVLVAGAAIAYYVYRKTNQTAIYNDRYPMAYR